LALTDLHRRQVLSFWGNKLGSTVASTLLHCLHLNTALVSLTLWGCDLGMEVP
jgi:hypothetical protein